jgi:hypothetical protein
LVVTIAFVISRLALANIAGVQFDNRPLNDALQLLDRGQLRDNLWESLINLHAQPPLFNLFVGVGLHAPSQLETPLFHALYLAIGLGIALSVYAVLRRLAVSAPWAVGLTVVFICSPGVFLYESWLSYDYLVVLLLAFSVLALQRYARGRRPWQAAVFVNALALLVLTRSLFHLVWFLLCVILVIVMATVDRRRVLAAVSIPVLLVTGLHFHRLATFGGFGLSSGLGVSLAKITVFQLSDEDRQALVAQGDLSAVAGVEPLSPPKRYDGLVPAPPSTGTPVLDEEEKGQYENPPTNDLFRMNMNSLAFLDISEKYLKDSLYVIRTYPDIYLQGVKTAIELYFRPTSDFFTLADNRGRVAAVESFYNKVVLGVVAGGSGERAIPEGRTNYRLGPARTAWTIVVAYAVAVIGGTVFLLRSLLKRRASGETVVVVSFLLLTIVYIFFVSNLIEVGENNRFRFYSDPLVLMLLAALAMRPWRVVPGPSSAPSDSSK